MFASKSVLEGAARGVVDLGALAAAIVLARRSGWGQATGSAALAIFALMVLRNSDVRTLGMVETVAEQMLLRPGRFVVERMHHHIDVVRRRSATDQPKIEAHAFVAGGWDVGAGIGE